MTPDDPRQVARDAETILASLTNLEIRSDAEFARDAAVLCDAAIKRSRFVETFKVETEELETRLARVRKHFAPAIGVLKELDRLLKKRMTAYVEARLAFQAALLRRAATEPERAEELILQAAAVPVPVAPGVTVGHAFFAEVRDLAAIPDRFLNKTPRLTDILKAARKGEAIPGVEAGTRPKITVRKRRTET